jgi:hypothetical protein
MAQGVDHKVNSIKGAASTSGYQVSEVEARLYHSLWGRERDTYQQQRARIWDEKVARIMGRIADRRAA